jgi:hypothetical protein
MERKGSPTAPFSLILNQFDPLHDLPPYSSETHYIRPAQPFMR